MDPPLYCAIVYCVYRIVGLGHTGRIEVGKRADFLVFDKELNLQQTVIAGKNEFKKE